ncbi:hypothetical protein HELRODRAFT_167287 [Helobdella robusta]|uniref:Meiosis-specific nuclear structural protein 1 n=1 Tax=Helobdella robusta TaxID=6412 RepID=T1EZ80_HELRO|nr:hypothetical protein HELRODRAFT_167287 [Helobdella robusta]ESO10787.1 hypothetical protein HELRODRAFT_167287 [Helobdella robusta]
MLSKRTHAQQQQRINRERVSEAMVFDNTQQYKQMEMKNTMMQIDERAVQRRNWREKMMEVDEAEKRDAYFKHQESERLRRERQEEEERMEEEAKRMNEEKIRNEKIRQKIVSNNEELKKLERQIQAAYAMKSMQEQMKKHGVSKQQEVAKDIEYAKILEEQNKKTNEKMMEDERMKLMASESYKKDLQLQKQTSELLKQEMRNKMMDWDKHLVDEEVRKIKEEDETSAQLARERRENYRKAIEEDEMTTAKMKMMMKMKTMMEEERIERYEKEKMLEEERRRNVRVEQNVAKERVKNELAARLKEEQEQRDELEQARLLLSQEELEQRHKINEQEKEIKRLREREELQRVREEMMMMRERMRRRDKEEEELFKKEMMLKFAEGDRLEQMNAQKQRLKRLEHQRQIEMMLEDKRKHQEMLREQELKALENEERIKAIEKLIVEEERKKLLKLHAPNLIGYLPKGVIRDENDLQMLGPDFIDSYQTIYA